MKQLFSKFIIVLTLGLMTTPLGYVFAECSRPIPELFEHVAPSVVYVSAVSVDPFKVNNRISASNGSGFIIDVTGLVLTNSHLVYGYNVIVLTLDNGEIVKAQLVGEDPVLDLAILRIPVPAGGLCAASLGDSQKIRVGERVLAIGNPLGLEQILTVGIVSGISRILPAAPMSIRLPLIQTDAAINPGNSGGPLVNQCGEVIGINTAMLPQAENIGFALPINLVREVIPQMVEKGRVIRPWVGVAGQIVSKELAQIVNLPIVDGFLVETVERGSPAEQVGLKGGILPITIAGMELLLGGDIITSGNDISFDDSKKFVDFVRALEVGDDVVLTVFSGGKTRRVVFRLPERPN
jgi:S1-C subfamily serine protease